MTPRQAQQQYDIQQNFFLKMVVTVFGYTILYSGVYLYLGARLTALVLLSTSIVCSTAVFIFEKAGFPDVARMGFCLSGLVYIFATPLGIRFDINAEYYYFCALMLPALLFEPTKKAKIVSAMLMCPLVWAVQFWVPMPELSNYWLPDVFPVHLFKGINFFGAALLIALFLKYFVDRFHLKSIEVIKTNERQEYILEGAGLGSWDWWIDSGKVVFDHRCCEMLGLKYEETPL